MALASGLLFLPKDAHWVANGVQTLKPRNQILRYILSPESAKDVADVLAGTRLSDRPSAEGCPDDITATADCCR